MDDLERKFFICAGILVFIVFGLIGISIYATSNFCNRYYPKVPTWECVASNRYKYDGDVQFKM